MKNNKTKKSHGGLRPNSGRKNLFNSKMKSIKLSEEQWAKARLIGNGCMAAGLRKAIDEFQIFKDKIKTSGDV